MKKILLGFLLLAGVFATSKAQNPLFWAADPSGIVTHDGRLFVFPTNDLKNWDDQKTWNCWSTNDLKTWTDHGVIFDTKMSGWGINNAWAPDITYKNGKYYFYYYFQNGGKGKGGVGVATSLKPEGPYTESTGKRLVEMHDPAIFNDDDGQSYLYSQNKVYLLNDDMISLKSDKPIILEVGEVPDKYEATYVFKRDDIYYFTYAKNFNHLVYFTGKSPLGPFEYRGEIMKPYGGNNHHSVVKYKGQWILFYHEWAPNESTTCNRRVRAEWLTFNADGTINLVTPTAEGISVPKK